MIKMIADSFSGEGPLPGKMVVFPLYPHKAEKFRGISGVSFIKGH